MVMVHASCESLRFGDVSPCRLRRQLITWGLSATGLILLSLVWFLKDRRAANIGSVPCLW